MKRTPFSSDQIAAALKQEELGMPVADVIRQAGITERTFLNWKKQYGGLPGYPHDLKCLQEENAKLKQIVAELTLEILACRMRWTTREVNMNTTVLRIEGN
ncbi:transposase family protein [Collimonas arenae]|uniref:transposase n=1 Tax=Collimonas arenae TaxID=279058 RepID=UPI0007783D44|nr:transposase [Collimonas arenae]AMP00405.1 transposase family protein [Collimonas arenae]